MNVPEYDVVIIGGGPGGSCAAAFARQKHLRTLVLEKHAFPRFRIGESLLPAGNAVLKETGAWPRIEAAGFIRKNGALFYLANGGATKTVDFSAGLVPGLDYTYQVERARFDELLLDHARSLGADVWTEAPVRAIAAEPDGHRIEVETPQGTRSLSAAWVLDASGRESSVSAPLKRALDPAPLPRRIAVYSHFRGVPRPEGRMDGATIVVRLEDGWFWVIPISAEITSVGLVASASALRATGLAPEALFHREVARSPELQRLMGAASATMPFHVTTDYSYFRRQLAEKRLLLVGDAGGFFDPIFSSGVYMSMISAKAAVERVARAHAERRALTARECRDYTREIKRHAGVFHRLIRAFYERHSFSVFMCNEVPWNLAPGLTSIVAGCSRLTWPLWWRYRVFLAVCRLQRFVAITPRIACE